MSRENGWRGLQVAPQLMNRPELLYALGLGDDPAEVICDVEMSGAVRQVSLPALPPAGTDAGNWVSAVSTGKPSTLDRWPGNLTWMRLPGNDLVATLKYDSVSDDEHGRLADMFAAAFRYLDVNDVRGLVVDLRNNGGGDNRLNWPLIDGIKARPRINRPERLFALVGRGTFSAAMHCAVYLEHHTECIFAGEPTGNSPNHFGDALDYELPNTKLTVRVSSLWWQESLPTTADLRSRRSSTLNTPQLTTRAVMTRVWLAWRTGSAVRAIGEAKRSHGGGAPAAVPARHAAGRRTEATAQ